MTHGNVVQAAANLTLAEGEAAIFAPDGGAGFALIARVLPEEWTVLVHEDATATVPATAEVPLPQPPGPTGAVCEPTPADGPGGFYTPNARLRDQVGRGYVLRGRVYSSANCGPLPHARLEFWLAGPEGAFDAEYRATVLSNPSGAYRFESHMPPAYDGSPPHIFVRVTARAHQTLVTRHYPIPGQTAGTFDLIVIPDE